MLELPVRLNSKRIFLRPHIIEDFKSFYNFMRNAETTQYLNFTPEQKTYEGAKNLLTFVINSYETDNPIFSLSIIHKISEEYLGSCGLSPIVNSKDIECYFSLLKEYWGNGYAVEAMKILFNYSFKTLALEKIIAYVNPNNRRSQKVAERAGMKYLGQISHSVTNDKVMYFSLTRKEFALTEY